MPIPQTDQSIRQKPLRLWPGVVAVALQWLVIIGVPIVMPEAGGTAILPGVAGGLVVLIWWLFFSRAPWLERLGVIGLMVVAVFATRFVVHESISNGMMGMMPIIFAIPLMSLALVASAAASRRLSGGRRRASMVAAILLACAVMTLVRTGGISGDASLDLHWRWTQTPEERLLAQAGDEPFDSAQGRPASSAPAAATAESPEERPQAQGREEPLDAARGKPTSPAPAAATPESPEKPVRVSRPEWLGFRGPERDSTLRGVRIEPDWSGSPPVELWRRPIGPGWSSFAVHGDFVYTQEQRGDDEIVSCYNLTTGAPVWRHRDAARFWESNAGPGPRSTPTLSNGRVYTFGATGILNALEAGNGAVVWSRNAATDTGVEIPGWGFASSPLVVNDLVIVAASGRLAAYDVATGRPRWFGEPGGGGYSSPHLATIDGVPQVLFMRGSRTISVAPADGTLLWDHSWVPTVAILQPALVADGDVLIAAGDMMGGSGIRRISVKHGSGKWTVEERWTSTGLKPYFSDFVVHEGHAFGFDGSILSCIDIKDGARRWKGGRYGHGQLLLLRDQDLLLVLSEQGELALVKATPDHFTELARFKAIEGKTWNHPVLVGDVLLVRNGEEMAAFRLSLAAPSNRSSP